MGEGGGGGGGGGAGYSELKYLKYVSRRKFFNYWHARKI
jgi:hypothetical protein